MYKKDYEHVEIGIQRRSNLVDLLHAVQSPMFGKTFRGQFIVEIHTYLVTKVDQASKTYHV